jgi:hypothetical protein
VQDQSKSSKKKKRKVKGTQKKEKEVLMGANHLPSHFLKDLSINRTEQKNSNNRQNANKPLRSIINCDWNEK